MAAMRKSLRPSRGCCFLSDSYANPAYPRFIVLNDALIGLDLQNRLPVLRILTSDAFKNYQVFLFTHDRVWFDLAREYLREEDDFRHLASTGFAKATIVDGSFVTDKEIQSLIENIRYWMRKPEKPALSSAFSNAYRF